MALFLIIVISHSSNDLLYKIRVLIVSRLIFHIKETKSIFDCQLYDLIKFINKNISFDYIFKCTVVWINLCKEILILNQFKCRFEIVYFILRMYSTTEMSPTLFLFELKLNLVLLSKVWTLRMKKELWFEASLNVFYLLFFKTLTFHWHPFLQGVQKLALPLCINGKKK